ncbi:ROK family protein [Microbacterium sp. NPDC076911]|uniref:ROK family protein n=1 Tax=Microbacterium sp. NPDC076911 TaxID=3154958 RepID=UPI00344719C7
MVHETSSAEPATTVSVALAVDIGGTKVETALVDARGRVVVSSRKRASTGRGITVDAMRAALHSTITDTLAALPDDAILVGAGIGSAGPIDRSAGTTAPLNMPHLQGFAVREHVASLLPEGTRVELGLDGMCIALAEWQIGAGRGVNDLICMVVSTGIGGGVVCGGIPVTGADGNAGHIGQLRVREWGRDVASTRQTGTLESIASGPASVAWARAQGWEGASGEDLSRDAAAGDEIARAAIVRSAHAVGEALAGVSALTSTRLVIIGGGFSHVSLDYLDLVQSRAREVAVLPSAQHLSVIAPQLGDTAPLVGAALLVLDTTHDDIRRQGSSRHD